MALHDCEPRLPAGTAWLLEGSRSFCVDCLQPLHLGAQPSICKAQPSLMRSSQAAHCDMHVHTPFGIWQAVQRGQELCTQKPITAHREQGFAAPLRPTGQTQWLLQLSFQGSSCLFDRSALPIVQIDSTQNSKLQVCHHHLLLASCDAWLQAFM